MSTKPTHRAYLVQEPKSEGGKARWLEVGTVWPHRNGGGFDLVIPEGMALTGRIVCVERRDENEAE
jgi:hypothetical protein